MPDQIAAQPAVGLDAVLRTPELGRRAPRAADHRAESQALLRLAGHLAESPRTILEAIAEVTLEVLGVGSAGISLLRADGSGFWWPAIAGAMAPVHRRRPAARGESLRCRARDRHLRNCSRIRSSTSATSVRRSRASRRCCSCRSACAARTIGTVWALSHDARRRFDGEDGRLLASVAAFASAAWQALESLGALDAEQSRLRDSEDRLAFALEASHIGAWDMDLASRTIVHSVEHDRLFGYRDAPARWTYDDLLAHVLPGDRERVDATFRAAVDGDADWNVECRVRRCRRRRALDRHRRAPPRPGRPDGRGGARRHGAEARRGRGADQPAATARGAGGDDAPARTRLAPAGLSGPRHRAGGGARGDHRAQRRRQGQRAASQRGHRRARDRRRTAASAESSSTSSARCASTRTARAARRCAPAVAS